MERISDSSFTYSHVSLLLSVMDINEERSGQKVERSGWGGDLQIA